jgi:hypothetical protein
MNDLLVDLRRYPTNQELVGSLAADADTGSRAGPRRTEPAGRGDGGTVGRTDRGKGGRAGRA